MTKRTGLGRHIRHAEAIGDPLEGLVNLFDIGIVLAIAFLIAGLGLTLNAKAHRLQKRSSASQQTQTIQQAQTSQQGQSLGQAQTLQTPAGAPSTRGRGEAVGTVYRLSDGQLIYVKKPAR